MVYSKAEKEEEREREYIYMNMNMNMNVSRTISKIHFITSSLLTKNAYRSFSV